jgi:Male sterility protein
MCVAVVTKICQMYLKCVFEEEKIKMSPIETTAFAFYFFRMSSGPLNGLDPAIDRVAECFKGKCIFITGGTGFVGKVLVEKMLRDCSELDTIYLLVRPKKGKEPSTRVDELFESPVSRNISKLATKLGPQTKGTAKLYTSASFF